MEAPPPPPLYLINFLLLIVWKSVKMLWHFVVFFLLIKCLCVKLTPSNVFYYIFYLQSFVNILQSINFLTIHAFSLPPQSIVLYYIFCLKLFDSVWKSVKMVWTFHSFFFFIKISLHEANPLKCILFYFFTRNLLDSH